MNEKKTTIGLRPENQMVIEEVMPYFNEQMDAARFAMALAIREDCEPKPTNEVETKWNIGSFDSDSDFRNLIQALYPDVDEPTRALESLINQGLQLLEDHLDERKEMDIPDLI
jgi:hypothetical protein